MSHRVEWSTSLVLDTSGGVAQDALVKNREHAASSALADGRADPAEVVGAGHRSGRVAAVQVSNTEDIGSAALGGAIETAAGNVGDLTLLDRGGEGSNEAGAEGNDGSGELHVGEWCHGVAVGLIWVVKARVEC